MAVRAHLRLVLVAVTSIALIAAAFALNRSSGTSGPSQADGLKKMYTASVKNAVAKARGDKTRYAADGTHVDYPGGPPHNDHDPRTKNWVSRAALTTDSNTADPTTPAKAIADERAAATQRRQRPVRLRHVRVNPVQPSIPTSRYNLFNACYGLRSTTTGRYLAGADPEFAARTLTGAAPLYFKPSSLGHYLLYSKAAAFLSGSGGHVAYAAAPGPAVNWTVTRAGPGRFRLFLPGSGYLSAKGGIGAGFAAAPDRRTQFTPYRRTGCTPFPEIGTNVAGDPTAGMSSFQEVRGLVDGHMHGMAFEFLGGDVHCGRPWSPWGVTVALAGCQGADAVASGLVGGFLSGKLGADPVGWPTFKDWPAPDALTQEGTYYKWIERNWRAGQRIMVNLLVENNQLCMIYPLKRNSCDDMTSLRLQAHDMHLLENYIDAQHGGPGKGFYRIVTNPEQAREVINAGKMAVVMGIETSVLFGCHDHFGQPSTGCTPASIDRQLTQVRAMGVTQMELVNKFDNALAGVAGDSGTTGDLVNTANILETGSAWHMVTCSPNDPEVHDKDQALSGFPSQDALFGAVVKAAPVSVLSLLPALPLYPAPHHCNTIGLSGLGADTIEGMAKRHMLFDPDHMSVKARQASLNLIDQLGYPGVISSHSWSTPDAYPRIYSEQGFITPYAGDSVGFVAKWKRHLTWANPRIYWGFGFGSDINGLGAQANPRPGASANPVTYPFTALGGVRVFRQVSGTHVYDINKDGVAHYGLYPDWIQDLSKIAGPSIVADMYRGPEAYLEMWERAYGAKPDACTNPGLRHSTNFFRTRLHPGMSWWRVLMRAGQPHRRIGQHFTYCTKGGPMTVNFSQAGKLVSVA
ncbi:MAG: hypothetical protein JWQ32_2672 [Marmoricola sp.]|nr:hypothetical protein [Marmoricola sp.]